MDEFSDILGQPTKPVLFTGLSLTFKLTLVLAFFFTLYIAVCMYRRVLIQKQLSRKLYFSILPVAYPLSSSSLTVLTEENMESLTVTVAHSS